MSDSKPFEIRADLLNLAKSILSENSHMQFEAGKLTGKPGQWNPVTTEKVIEEAEKLAAFVSNKR